MALSVWETDEYSVLAAEVAGAHGVSGGLRLRLIAGSSDAAARSLKIGRKVRASRALDGAQRDLTVKGLRKQPKGFWIVQFQEVTDRNEAEALHGFSLFIREAERASLPEGEYYVDQLLGLDVLTNTGRGLGKLADVLNTPAHDVYVTDSGAMIPAAGDFIVGIDLDAGKIVVRDVPGLRDEA